MPIHDWTLVPAGIFHHFHHCWITAISDALNAGRMPPEYYALAEQIAGGLGPDVLTLENVSLHPVREGNGATTGNGRKGGIALATLPPQVRFTFQSEPEQYAGKRKRIAIRHCSDDRVVAILEIVSPGNKESRHSLRSFVEKAAEFLRGGIHLLVVDLFPPTPRDPQGIHKAIWDEIRDESFQPPPDLPLTLASYVAGYVKTAYVEPVAVGSTLPDMPLFLEPDWYVPVPLDATYQTAFAAVPKRWRDVLAPPTA